MPIKSNLPYKTLMNFITHITYCTPQELKLSIKEREDFLAYLVSLKDVYIPCSRCERMIAPDEIYQIENEEAVCEQCYEEE